MHQPPHSATYLPAAAGFQEVDADGRFAPPQRASERVVKSKLPLSAVRKETCTTVDRLLLARAVGKPVIVTVNRTLVYIG